MELVIKGYKFLSPSFNSLLKRKLRFIQTLADNCEEKIIVKPDLDFKYLCSPENTLEIKNTIHNRKAVANIEKVIQLHQDFQHCDCNDRRKKIEVDLFNEALKIPNKSHPIVKKLNGEPKVLRIINKPKDFLFTPLPFEQLTKKLNFIKTEGLTNLTGPRSYYLIESLSELEEALIQYTINHLLKREFLLVSVPDLLPRTVIEYCGMDTRGERTQVYSLDEECGRDICLSGTAEMGIAHLLQGKKFNRSKLPIKFASVSRCFRAEISKISIEKGIYRVHQFTKVEMFGLTKDTESSELLEEFCHIQETLFSALGLYLRILDMPECELGSQAYRKFDIEGFMPGKKFWGELSSASNCTDFQTRRLGIQCEDGTYPHTINGTACAIPRLMIAILETNQRKDGSIEVPKNLIPYLGYETIYKSKIPPLSSFKIK
ncbi:hypothetical protein O3M35_008168 [Rhynocoris fuscipes]|uniref:serine--tRNA ligase n=1 Tax=Rhynocoris fuscipes TaxID=488301 RepID=A0AAW1DB56_9HEMI